MHKQEKKNTPITKNLEIKITKFKNFRKHKVTRAVSDHFMVTMALL